VARAGAEGTREVLEILELENTGVTTRVTRDTLVPTWAGRVPPVGQFRAAGGHIERGDAVPHDSVIVLAPIAPGARSKSATRIRSPPARARS